MKTFLLIDTNNLSYIAFGSSENEARDKAKLEFPYAEFIYCQSFEFKAFRL